MALSFSQSAMDQSAASFAQAKLAPEQNQIVRSLSGVLIRTLPMSELAMAGFLVKAIGQWQTEHRRQMTELVTLPPAERIKAVGQVGQVLKGVLRGVLAGKADGPTVDVAVDGALQAYAANFAKR